MSEIPPLVRRDIADAVRSALQFGVDVNDFLQIAREEWSDELRLKREADDETFARRLADV